MAMLPNSTNNGASPQINSVLDGISTILTKIKVPDGLAEKLNERMVELNDSGIPAFGFIPGLLKALPNRLEEFSQIMRLGLTSHKEDVAKGSARALNHWLTFATEPNSDILLPPDDLVREIGIIIATRRTENLAFALGTAKRLFDSGTDTQGKTIHDLILNGLNYLSAELQYERDDFDEEDRPLLRWHCVRLAHSMSRHGLQSNPTIVHWLQAAAADPLPEVRYAID